MKIISSDFPSFGLCSWFARRVGKMATDALHLTLESEEKKSSSGEDGRETNSITTLANLPLNAITSTTGDSVIQRTPIYFS